MLTIHLLAKNNSETIGECLDSLRSVDCRVVVGDMGSDDGTRDMCFRYGADVQDVGDPEDFSSVRNLLCGEGLNMYMEPWERLVSGADLIGSLRGGHAFYVIQGGIVSKQIRLWENGRFENPVFESVVGAKSVVTPQVAIVAGNQPDSRENNLRMCHAWSERRPTSPDPHYYLACSLLALGRKVEFSVAAKKFLTMVENSGESALMMNYYLSRVELSHGDLDASFRRAVGCLATCPSFAEFWCLLGDILYSKGEYERARHMYENARIAGMRRKSDDSLPVDIAKYDVYPRSMEEKCRSTMSKGIILGANAIRKA